MTVRILCGDVRERLAELPDESVHCVVTSPPYFGLRDYGVEGQIGLEATPAAFVDVMVEVFRDVRRVLRKDGTLWLNLGDSYAGSGRGVWNVPDEVKIAAGIKETYRPSTNPHMHSNAVDSGAIGRNWVKPPAGLKAKDLMGIPWRVAFALQADGWYLRQDIIWSKPNPMPESVTDRCTKAHEYLFLLSKSERYYFDAGAIAEPSSELSGWAKQRANGSDTWKYNDTEARRRQTGQSVDSSTFGTTGVRNKRSVWTVTTQPFSEAHFATFPPALIEPCILAGSPEGGTVLDPFGGAGTTGLVADRLKRNAILIELNPTYAEMAERRISNDGGMFGSVSSSRLSSVQSSGESA